MTPQLTLNGEAVILSNMTLTPSMSFKESDQSGQSSSTNTAEQGIKGKELKVSGLISYKNQAQLTRLFTLAEALDASGSLQRYRVGSAVSLAINLREATFSGTIEAAPAQGKMAWQVSFTLKEKSSVPEKKAARVKSPPTSKQTPIPEGAITQEDLNEPDQERTWFERVVLGPVNEALGGGNEAD